MSIKLFYLAVKHLINDIVCFFSLVILYITKNPQRASENTLCGFGLSLIYIIEKITSDIDDYF